MTAINNTPTIKNLPQRHESFAWRYMRYSAFLLIPLVWVHAIIQALISGGHNLSIGYVEVRWEMLGWRIYDAFLLAFALSHGVNGLRQVLLDFTSTPQARKWVNWGMFVFWLLMTLIGGIALVGGVRGF